MKIRTLAAGGLLGALLAGCGRPVAVAPDDARAGVAVPANLAVAMVAQPGERDVDREIRRCQEKVRAGGPREAWVERLGWAYVAKARESFDPGYYKLAEVCADALEAVTPGGAAGLLLRGHVLDSLHRFKEAEPIARELVAKRGLAFDHALLGDVLMEQGRLAEAVPAYQKAMDLRPDLHSYARASYIRWLMGDLEGAIEMMQAAVGASSSVDAASVAWTCSRLAGLDFQAGKFAEARKACDAALAALGDYPPALLLQGRMRLAAGQAREAVAPMERAAKRNPLPEMQWALADALRAAGRAADAAKVEEALRTRGAVGDPRTYALYLATRGQDAELAVRLAGQELAQRQDVFTHDAMAWALAAAGRLPEARTHMDQALAAGTEDGRLYLHAAVIAARSGDIAPAREWMARARELQQLLLPSEREQLDRLAPVVSGLAARPVPFPAPESLKGGKTNPQPNKKS